MLYQKLCDPPGDRLLRIHLAGVWKPDQRPLGKVLSDAYRPLSWQQMEYARASNVAEVFNHQTEWWASCGRFLRQAAYDLWHGAHTAADVSGSIRSMQFFHFMPSLAFFSLGPLFLLAGVRQKWRTVAWKTALLAWCYVCCVLILWIALMFTPEAAKVHQGSYVCGLLAVAASTLAIWTVSPRLAQAFILLQAALNFVLYVIYAKGISPPGTLGQGIVLYPDLVLLVVSLLFLAALLRSLAGSSLSSAWPFKKLAANRL